MNNQDYADAIKATDEHLKLIQDEKSALLAEWLVKNCPIKIGDIVASNDYSFKGKNIKVNRIYVTTRWRYRDEWYWVATGLVLTKDGSVGRNTSRYGQLVADIKEKE